MNNIKDDYVGLYKLTLALRLLADGAKLLPLTHSGKLQEDYNFFHIPNRDELIAWFALLNYEIGILNKETITHIKVNYAKPNGEYQQISTNRTISDMVCEVHNGE